MRTRIEREHDAPSVDFGTSAGAIIQSPLHPSSIGAPGPDAHSRHRPNDLNEMTQIRQSGANFPASPAVGLSRLPPPSEFSSFSCETGGGGISECDEDPVGRPDGR